MCVVGLLYHYELYLVEGKIINKFLNLQNMNILSQSWKQKWVVYTQAEKLPITTVHCNLAIATHCKKMQENVNKSFWLSTIQYWFLIVQKQQPKTLCWQPNGFTYAFSHPKSQWPSHNKWLYWTNFLLVT